MKWFVREALEKIAEETRHCSHDMGFDREIGPLGCALGDKCVCMPIHMMAAEALSGEAEAEWLPIETYHAADKFVKVKQVLCGHSEKKWIRFGRYYPEMKHWYYSGSNERSQWSQVQGDAPTHWQPLPEPPK